MYTNTVSKSKRSVFTPQEDWKLIKLVKKSGKQVDWKTISIDMNGRTPRQCRERYTNYLDPKLTKTNFTVAEDQQIVTLFNNFGPSWQKIASYFQGRTANSVRNRFLFLNRRNQNTNISQFQSTDSEVDVKIDTDHLTELFVVPDFQIPVDSIFFDCQ